jgi:hypothetical protein
MPGTLIALPITLSANRFEGSPLTPGRLQRSADAMGNGVVIPRVAVLKISSYWLIAATRTSPEPLVEFLRDLLGFVFPPEWILHAVDWGP